VVSGSRITAFLVVIATVMRVAGKLAFAQLGLIQSTVGLLEYAAVGLSPAIIRLTTEALRHGDNDAGSNRSYETAPLLPAVRVVYANGFAMALLTALTGGLAVALFMPWFKTTHVNLQTGNTLFELALMVAIATLLRMISDAPGAVLQTRGRIFADNLFLSLHEIVWGGGTVIGLYVLHWPWQRATGWPLMAGSAMLLALRSILSHHMGSGVFERWWTKFDGRIVRRLLLFGGMIVAAQMADFLYAPTDYLIITKLISFETVADYVPAVEVDGGMLLLASALALVLMPRTAIAHVSGDSRAVRRYYLLGTLATAAMLLVIAPFIWWASPFLFRLLLGNPFPATCAILPWMLIHTVIGGSSAVGRSILLAIGKVRAFTASVLIAGVANVVLNYTLVRFFHLGLKGIVLGTIVAATARCAIWLPWYTLRVLRQQAEMPQPPSLAEEEMVSATLPPLIP